MADKTHTGHQLLRWGILSTANIASRALIPALLQSRTSTLEAVASRDIVKARRCVASLPGQVRAYGSYEDLLADDRIDVVYIPTPNHLHLALSMAAIEAGKHVLCEKPIGLNQAEAQQLIERSRAHPDIKVMEAFMYRFHPQWKKVKQLVDENAIGPLAHVHTNFCYRNLDPDNVRNKCDIGGGALLDIGCYAISLSRWLFGSLPERVSAIQAIDGRFGTDAHTSALMRFPSGTASFYCATQVERSQSVEVFGEHGHITITLPFNPVPEQACEVALKTQHEEVRFRFVDVNHYVEQVEAFAHCVLFQEAVPTPLQDALDNMKVIDAIIASAQRRDWVPVSGE